MDPITLFGVSVSGVVILVISFVCCTVVIVGGSLAIPLLLRRNKKKQIEDLMARGTQGEATVLSLEDTGMFVNNNPRVKITLEIRMPMREPYQLTKTTTIPMIRLSQIQPSSVIGVVVDMSDPNDPDNVGLMLK